MRVQKESLKALVDLWQICCNDKQCSITIFYNNDFLLGYDGWWGWELNV